MRLLGDLDRGRCWAFGFQQPQYVGSLEMFYRICGFATFASSFGHVLRQPCKDA